MKHADSVMLQFNKPSRRCITEPFSAGGRARPSFTLHLFDIYGRVLDAKMNISPHNRTATVWRPLGQELDNILLRAGEVNSAGGLCWEVTHSVSSCRRPTLGKATLIFMWGKHSYWENPTFRVLSILVELFVSKPDLAESFYVSLNKTSTLGWLKNSSYHRVSSPSNLHSHHQALRVSQHYTLWHRIVTIKLNGTSQ